MHGLLVTMVTWPWRGENSLWVTQLPARARVHADNGHRVSLWGQVSSYSGGQWAQPVMRVHPGPGQANRKLM